MSKKVAFIALSMLLVLSGCLPGISNDDEEEGVGMEEEETDEEVEMEVSPEIPSLDHYYRSVLQDGEYVHGETRGYHTDIVYNRVDLERLEVGLQEIASQQFNQEDYFFREGQFIQRGELNQWLLRYREPTGDDEGNPLGLNPPLGEGDSFEQRERSNPRVLSSILEHNYMIENDHGQLQIGGIVIGLSMNSVYYFRERFEDGRYGPTLEENVPIETSLEEGQRIASIVLERLRSQERENGALENVPIIFAIYREMPRESLIPGHFLATATAPPGEEIGDWTTINERYYLFPSAEANEAQREDSEIFNQFKNDINRFFENFVGVVGEGYYQNDRLQKMKISIPITFYSKTEVIALTQHVTDRVQQRFPEEVKIEVEVSSAKGQEALILKEPGRDPFVYVY